MAIVSDRLAPLKKGKPYQFGRSLGLISRGCSMRRMHDLVPLTCRCPIQIEECTPSISHVDVVEISLTKA